VGSLLIDAMDATFQPFPVPDAGRVEADVAQLLTAFCALLDPIAFLLDSYQSFNAFTTIGLLIGLACGSVVLTCLYLGTGGSIPAVTIWHGLFNMATATDGATNLIASTVSQRPNTATCSGGAVRKRV
jgi:hypothetical protein